MLSSFLSILIAILTPAIAGSIESARTAAMKNKGRGIWVSIVVANAEREPLDMEPLWPSDLAKKGIVFENAEDYFCYLMSDGKDKKTIARDPERRVVPDLKPEMLTGPGMKAAAPGGPLLPENNAWHVILIDDEAHSEVPFIVTRNVKASAIAWPSEAELADMEANAVHIPLDKDTKPFRDVSAIWATRGGSVISAPARYLIRARM
ncbi:MAG: hypothetical protein FWF96_06685, partial [Kiritimatiellaeota bacterium]|nr:hypothetical protein [Kiritimatiellota bacterium]